MGHASVAMGLTLALLWTGPLRAATPVAASTPPAAGVSYEQAKAWADRDEASLSSVLSQKLVESQGKVLGAVLPGCGLSIPHPNGHADLTPFVVVMQLDASGQVVRTWLHGTTPLAVCFHRGMRQQVLFVPPRVPFYTSIELALTEKDAGA